MLRISGLAPQQLTKTRYALNLPGGDWVVDCFAGENAPLCSQRWNFRLLYARSGPPGVAWSQRQPLEQCCSNHPLSRWPRDLKDSFDLL